jgi:S-adenosyl-L-methionine hydrolase (adenosine-forming)
MAKPVLTLTTDFGTSGHYVAAMKGVILSICPEARIVDVCHDVRPFEIAEAAYLIAQVYRTFPKDTVHVVVVDPGVGTSRRPILMEAAGQRFVAPDNGALAMIYSREKAKVRLISNEKLFRKPVSRTFHGRDIFAPVAARIAGGLAPARVGRRIEDYLRPAFEKPKLTGDGAWTGYVLHIDRFGNVVTNFQAADFPDLDRLGFRMTLGQCEVAAMARNYAERGPGELFVIEGSSGYLEISVGQASAAAQIGCHVGAVAELTVM